MVRNSRTSSPQAHLRDGELTRPLVVGSVWVQVVV